jgi:predicted AlkP superfamily phosphohydrolase/phosphomutase
MRILIVGFDAFDPVRFERLAEEGRLPHLSRYVELGGYAHPGVSNPPQTEVSWTSIDTGLDPGGHGIFDFVHRDPATYTPYVSLLPTQRSLFGTRFVPPFEASTIFDEVARQGYPASILWWPATFPCVAPEVVPGVLFSNCDLGSYSHPSHRDIPFLVLGKGIDQGDTAPPPRFSQEDQELAEERLRSLGYL